MSIPRLDQLCTPAPNSETKSPAHQYHWAALCGRVPQTAEALTSVSQGRTATGPQIRAKADDVDDGRPEPRSSGPGLAADLAQNITTWPLPTTWEAFLPRKDEMSSSPHTAVSFLEKLAATVLATYQALAPREKAEGAFEMISAILIYCCPYS